jgi:hypothetical protein
MDCGTMISKVQKLFGDTSEVEVSRADIRGWLNEGQIDIARKTECLKKHAQTDTLTSTGSYDLPDDFIKISRVTLNNYVLSMTSFPEMDNYDKDRDVSTPVGQAYKFYVWGRTITVYPYPSVGATDNLDIWYIKRPADMDEDTDISELPSYLHEDVVRYALIRAKEVDEEFEQASRIQADYDLRLIQSREDSQNLNANSYPAVRSVPGDDW